MSVIELNYSGKLIQSEVGLPGSKSISNRLLILEALSEGKVKGIDYSDAEDTRTLVHLLKHLPEYADAGAGGTTFRFLLALLASKNGYEGVLTGSQRLQERPVKQLVEALNSLGADVKYAVKTGFPPLIIKGRKLNGGRVFIDGSISSQFLSALLLVAPAMRDGLELIPQGKIASMPYLKMTVEVMRVCGIVVEMDKNGIHVKPSSFKTTEIQVEKDWSAAAFWFNCIALSGQGAEISMPGLTLKTVQGDALTGAIYSFLGVNTYETATGIVIRKAKLPTKYFAYNFSDQPDLAQAMAVSVAGNEISAMFSGLHSLRGKETDRIVALTQELKKFDVKITEPENGILKIDAREAELYRSPNIKTYEDHRMAMAFAGMVIKSGTLKISNPDVVRKSYPGFWNDLRTAGISIK